MSQQKYSSRPSDVISRWVGKKYGRLKVIEILIPRKAVCECDCGNTTIVFRSNLTRGNTASCGCLWTEKVAKGKKHGLSDSVEYHSWSGMKKRCYNKNSHNYHWYGGRGIKVCDRWMDSFENFIKDMGRKQTEDHSLDRINPNGNYEPDNCRWASHKEQCNNRRLRKDTLILEHNGESKTVHEWSEITGLNVNAISKRIKNYHWPIDKALSIPPIDRKNRGKSFNGGGKGTIEKYIEAQKML